MGASTLNLAPILFAFVAILGFIGALKGLTRGISRQVIRIITIAASVIIAFFISTAVYNALIDFLNGKTMDELVVWLNGSVLAGSGTDFSWLTNIDMETLELVLTLPMALIVMPIIFVILFVLISGIMLIIHAILCAIFGLSKKRNNLLTRLLGMALGLIQGVAVAGLLLTPFVGICVAVEETVTVLNEEAPEEEATVALTEVYDTYIKSLTDNIVFKAYSNLGINAIYESIATVDINGSEFNTTTLLPDFASITGQAMQLKGADFKNLTPENEASINAIVDVIDRDDYIKKVAAGAIKTLGHFFTSGDVGMQKLGEPLDSLILAAMEIFTTTDETTVVADFTTIKDVYFILSRDKVLSSFDQGSDALLATLTKQDAEGVTTVTKVMDTINKNERTKALTKLITQISISVISNKTGLDESNAQTYDNVIAGINNGAIKINKNEYATEEEYVDAVAVSLDATLKENNIDVEPEIVDDMAQYIADNYSDKDEITEEEANDIILSYYDAYMKNK